MSSIMRARSALTGCWEEVEVIAGPSLELKVAGPSMLGIGCPDRHLLRFMGSKEQRRSSFPRERVRSSAQLRRPACPGEGRESNSKRTYALSLADLSVTRSRTLRQALVK